MFFSVISAPLVSALCIRFSCRSISLLGGLLLGVGLVGTAFAPNIITVYFTFGLLSGTIFCIFANYYIDLCRSVFKSESMKNNLGLGGLNITGMENSCTHEFLQPPFSSI